MAAQLFTRGHLLPPRYRQTGSLPLPGEKRSRVLVEEA
jgi:hypothetical protein